MLKKHLMEYGTDTRSRNADDDLRKKNGQNKISFFSKIDIFKICGEWYMDLSLVSCF